MSNTDFVTIGVHLINLEAVASVHWEGNFLFVHLVGGRFLKLDAADGAEFWQCLESVSARHRRAEPPVASPA